MDVELLEVRQHDAGVLARDVREDHVSRGLLRGAGKPDHVTDRPALAQHPERQPRDLSGSDDPHVDHRRSVSRGSLDPRALPTRTGGGTERRSARRHRERRSPRPHERASQGDGARALGVTADEPTSAANRADGRQRLDRRHCRVSTYPVMKHGRNVPQSSKRGTLAFACLRHSALLSSSRSERTSGSRPNGGFTRSWSRTRSRSRAGSQASRF